MSGVAWYDVTACGGGGCMNPSEHICEQANGLLRLCASAGPLRCRVRDGESVRDAVERVVRSRIGDGPYHVEVVIPEERRRRWHMSGPFVLVEVVTR